MTRWATSHALLLTLATLAGCGDTGQARVQIPLAVAGTAPEPLGVGDWDVTVREARVAFGPLYLCSSQNAGLDACAHAAAEHLGATGFDALSPMPTPMGHLTGTTGVTVLSGMWDYGRAWRVSERAPRPVAGAIEGEHSAVISLEASHRTEAITRLYRFVVDVDGGTQPSGSTAVRTRLTAHRISHDDVGLVVRFDPTLWASMLDYDALALLPETSPGAPTDVPAAHTASGTLTIALTASGLPSLEWQSVASD